MSRPFAIAALLLAIAAPAWAGESAAVRSDRATMTLAAEVTSVTPGQPFRIGLRQRLAPGWHTYWQNPGDAGLPPELALNLPAGASSGEIQWPAPFRIPFGPLVNYGYEGATLLPLVITPPADLAPGQDFTIRAHGNWLVCEQVCIPEEGSFVLTLPVEAAARTDTAMAPLFQQAEADIPRPSPWQARIGFGAKDGALLLEGADLSPQSVKGAFFFPAEFGVLDHAGPQPLQVAEGALRLGLPRGEIALPARVEGVIAITDGAGIRSAYNISAAPGPVPTLAGSSGTATGQASPSQLPLGQALLWAALGGLILNLMPCVFPILAMKALGIARLSGAARSEVRAHGASYTAGVVLSFLALGGGLLALRLAGQNAGWGFQFTSAPFVALTGWLMLAVGLNLSGVFQFSGPVGAGGALTARGGHLGSFATGALAVLVATPCTAPFMAAAIGAALALPPAGTMAVFAAMGFGMAAPYALLALAPGLARLLPRPGAWMERLKQLLAFPMYGAALWLLWVLAQLTGPEGLAAALAGGLAIGFGGWALGTAQTAQGRGWRLAGRGGAILALVLAALLLPRLLDAPPGTTTTAEAGAQPWSESQVAEMRAQGRPVFVNLTAAWCITCKVNERLALNTDAVRNAFAERNVVYLTGDWTRGGEAISALLRSHGREGVPLYLVYPANGGAPQVLPQILTESIVLRALTPAQTAGDARGAVPG
jgi:thiol:disulfide interchange protein DsbD